MQTTSVNTKNLMMDADWLDNLIMHSYQNDGDALHEYPPPRALDSPSTYADFLTTHVASDEDRLLIVLGLATSIYPQLLEQAFQRAGFQQKQTIYGGITGKNFRGFIPTGETYLYLVAKENRAHRLDAIQRLKNSPLILSGAVTFNDPYPGEPFMSGAIVVDNMLQYALMMDAPVPQVTHESQS